MWTILFLETRKPSESRLAVFLLSNMFHLMDISTTAKDFSIPLMDISIPPIDFCFQSVDISPPSMNISPSPMHFSIPPMNFLPQAADFALFPLDLIILGTFIQISLLDS